VNVEAARRPRLVWAVGVVVMVLAGLAGLGVFLVKQPYGFDLWAYVLAARHLLAGEPMYSAEPQMPAGPLGEYHYAPIVAVPFALLAPLPFWLAVAVWVGLNTGIAAAIGVHLIRPLPRDARPWAAAAFVLFLPTILEISLGNLNLITVGLCLVAWSQRKRAPAAGTILAIAIGVKLLPLTIALFYLASGRYRVAMWTVTAAIVGLIATAVVFARDFPGYLAVLLALKDSHWDTDFIANARPAEVAAILGSPVGRWLLPFTALATATVGGLAARRAPRDETHLHHLALAFAPYLALFSLLWIPYLVFSLPLMASTFRKVLLLSRGHARRLLIASIALSWLLMQIVGREDEVRPLVAHLLGLLVLLAIALAVLLVAQRDETTDAAVARVAA
jgi:hypothetical protein